MSRWLRVFGNNDSPVEPVLLLQRLSQGRSQLDAHFRGDDQGWFEAELQIAPEKPALALHRYLGTEEGIRAELNTWAAWLESIEDSSNAVSLMQRVISARQLFTLQMIADSDEREMSWCIDLCRFLARHTDGVYQIDGRGFFAANGMLLVPNHEP